jgi:hypothetical protein
MRRNKMGGTVDPIGRDYSEQYYGMAVSGFGEWAGGVAGRSASSLAGPIIDGANAGYGLASGGFDTYGYSLRIEDGYDGDFESAGLPAKQRIQQQAQQHPHKGTLESLGDFFKTGWNWLTKDMNQNF